MGQGKAKFERPKAQEIVKETVKAKESKTKPWMRKRWERWLAGAATREPAWPSSGLARMSPEQEMPMQVPVLEANCPERVSRLPVVMHIRDQPKSRRAKDRGCHQQELDSKFQKLDPAQSDLASHCLRRELPQRTQ
jgi:hypothetical protein